MRRLPRLGQAEQSSRNRRLKPANPYPEKLVPKAPRIWYPNPAAYDWLKYWGRNWDTIMFVVYGVLKELRRGVPQSTKLKQGSQGLTQ